MNRHWPRILDETRHSVLFQTTERFNTISTHL